MQIKLKVIVAVQVIEILGRDNVQMSPKQVKQIIDLIGKFL
jgi:hypothetical protein